MDWGYERVVFVEEAGMFSVQDGSHCYSFRSHRCLKFGGRLYSRDERRTHLVVHMLHQHCEI